MSAILAVQSCISPAASPSKSAIHLEFPEGCGVPLPPSPPPSSPPPALSPQCAAEEASLDTAGRSTTPEIPPPSPSIGQSPEGDAEEDEPEPWPSPASSRPGSAMSIDIDDLPEDSPLRKVDEKDDDDLSRLGELDLAGFFSPTVHHIWRDDLPDDHPPEPDSHFPSKNPWPTANFTEVDFRTTWNRSQPAGFQLPSGRPTPIPTSSTIPDRYVFSSSPSPVNLTEPSDFGLVYRRRYLGDIVTLRIGPRDVEFNVHKELLTSSSRVFAHMFGCNWKEASEGRVHLDEDDPNAWALIVDWLYCGDLPPFKPVWALDLAASVTIKSRSGDQMKRIPLPSYFGPPIWNYSPHTEGRSVNVMRLGHLCTQPFYESVSADELRLIERHMHEGEFAARYFYYLQSGSNLVWSEKPTDPSQRDDAFAPPSLTEQQHSDMHRHLTTSERIPIPVPFPGFVEAEFLQLTLVKVIILAHKYALDDLFNDAMDMYRRGEKELERRHPVIRHVELAYAFCSRVCPLVTLMADMAAFSAKVNTMAPEVLEFAAQCAEFQKDLAARHDRRVVFPGFDRRRGAVDVFQSPLSGAKNYHVERETERRGGTGKNLARR